MTGPAWHALQLSLTSSWVRSSKKQQPTNLAASAAPVADSATLALPLAPPTNFSLSLFPLFCTRSPFFLTFCPNTNSAKYNSNKKQVIQLLKEATTNRLL